MTREHRLADITIALLLCGSMMVYLAALPRNPATSDEAIHLLEARRIVAGEVMYRDFFDLVTPGWLYLMALLFRVFGTTLTTARMAGAVIQGLSAAFLFLICRRIGVRRALALAAVVAHFVVAQAVFPIASYHWLGTLLCLIVLYLLAARVDGSMSGCGLIGLALGLLVCVHQERGLTIGLGVAVFFVADALIVRRPSPPARRVVVRLGALFLGIAAVVLPVMGFCLARAGLRPVWDALVLQPLVNYRHAVGTRWGSSLDPGYGIPFFLKYSPVTLALSAPRAVLALFYVRDDRHTRTAALLTSFALFSMLSICYYPDYIHIALIAATFFIIVVDAAERVAARLSHRAQRLVVAVAAAAVLIPSMWWLGLNAAGLQARYTVRYRSAFGTVDLPHSEDVELLQKLEMLLRDVPGRTLYCHPWSAGTCLLLDARNPTRFELLAPSYNTRAQYQEVIDSLRAAAVPYLVAVPALHRNSNPLEVFVRSDYAPLPDSSPAARYIWQRKPAPNG